MILGVIKYPSSFLIEEEYQVTCRNIYLLVRHPGHFHIVSVTKHPLLLVWGEYILSRVCENVQNACLLYYKSALVEQLEDCVARYIPCHVH